MRHNFVESKQARNSTKIPHIIQFSEEGYPKIYYLSASFINVNEFNEKMVG